MIDLSVLDSVGEGLAPEAALVEKLEWLKWNLMSANKQISQLYDNDYEAYLNLRSDFAIALLHDHAARGGVFTETGLEDPDQRTVGRICILWDKKSENNKVFEVYASLGGPLTDDLARHAIDLGPEGIKLFRNNGGEFRECQDDDGRTLFMRATRVPVESAIGEFGLYGPTVLAYLENGGVISALRDNDLRRPCCMNNF